MRSAIGKKAGYGAYGIIFIAPFFLIFLIFQLYPMIYSIAISFTDYAGLATEKNVVFFKQYAELLHNARFLQSIANTFIIWTMNFIPQIVLSFAFAFIFTSTTLKLKGAGVFKIIYYLPNIVTATSVAVLFGALFNRPDGIMDKLFKALNFVDKDFNVFRSVWGARTLISFIQFWRYFGYTTLTLAAGMMGINPAFYEAATLDGASRPKTFFAITLPLMRPLVLYTLVTSLVGGLQIFEIPLLLSEGLPMMAGGKYATETAALYIYQMAFGYGYGNEYALASAASAYLFVISAVLSFVTFKFFGETAFGLTKKDKKKKGASDVAGMGEY